MDLLGQTALILAVTAFALAVTALSRNLRNKLVLSYASLCGAISFWAFFFFLEKIVGNGTFYRAHLAFNLLLAPVGLFFIRVLTRVETTFTKGLFHASVVYAVAVLILQRSSWGETPVVLNMGYFAPTFLALECVYLMYLDWEIKRGKLRRVKISTVGLTRRTWVYTGALFLLMTAVMDHLPLMGDMLPSVGNILMGIYLFLISEAIIQQRLLNLNALMSRVLSIGFVCLLLTLTFLGLTAWVEDAPELYFLNTFVAAFIIYLLFEPIQKGINYAVMRVTIPKYLKYEKSVEESQLALSGILDTMGLAQLSLNFLESALRFESATFFILRSDGTKFRRLRGVHDEHVTHREILANHAVPEFFVRMRRRGEVPVILDTYLENEIDRTTSQAQRQAFDLVLKGLHGLNANIAIPFMDIGSTVGTEVLAFVAIKAPQPPELWGNNWGVLRVIYPFFQQAARTLNNMDVYVRLREKERLAALGEMAAGLAHEIRNPLGAIKGAAQFLGTQSDQAISPFLGVIVEEVNRLNKVVTEFLDYSKPYSAEMSETDIKVILEKTHALFLGFLAGSANKDKIQIEFIKPSNGSANLPHVLAAPEQIKQVMVNIIQNSIQALERKLPDEGGKITFGVKLENKGKPAEKELVIFVEDNGPGISRESLEKIFIPFYTTAPGGTGLGLAICSRIVEAHGGRIEAQSEEGKFTRFLIRLPVTRKTEELLMGAQA